MPSSPKFSIKEALYFGWKTVKANLLFLAGVIIFLFIVGFLGDWLSDKAYSYGFGPAYFLSVLVIAAVGIILEMGLLRITIDFAEGEKPSFSRLFSQSHLFFKYLGALVIYNLSVFIGLILFIVPGIILAVGLMFYSYLIIDLGLSPIKAIKKSWALTRGTRWRLFAFSILAGLINILGAIFLLIGLLVTLPLTLIATAYIYRKLLSVQAGSEDIHPVISEQRPVTPKSAA